MRERLRDFLSTTFRFKRAIGFVWDSGPIWVIGNIILLAIQGVLPILSLYLMKLVIDAVTNTLSQPAGARDFGPVLQILLLTGGVALITAVITQIGDSFTRVQGLTFVDHMNGIIQNKAMQMDLEYYENSQYQDTLHRAQREAAFRPLVILNGLAATLQNAISLLGVGWLLVNFYWVVVPLLFVAVLPVVVVRLWHSNRQYKLDRLTTIRDRRSWYYHMILVSSEFAKEVRIFGLGPTIRDRYQKLRTEIRALRITLETRHTVFTILAQGVSVIVIYGLFALIAHRTIMGTQTLGDLVMYFQAFQRGEGFLRGFLNGIARLYENNLFLTNLYEFLALERKVVEATDPAPVPVPIRGGIRFENVSFTYPNNNRQVLQDINLTVGAGEVVALVGENGSGKTTLVKLLCRLYDPTGGRIQIDDCNLKRFSTDDLRRHIGVIFQDYAHYNLTAADNIWFGGVHRLPALEDIEEAARLSDIHQVFRGLKNGYNTVLGNLFDSGQELSIGQWQKVALSRAFFRDAQVLILDEPTSALDPKAEYELFLKFRELLDGRTAILISHRLSTVRMADRIYVIHNGCITESGTHEELIALHGRYARFFEQQAQSYR